MKNKIFILIAFVFMCSGVRANTCATATSISIKTTFTPDTFQFSGTEYWFAFTGSAEASFYVNNYIRGVYAGINRVDLYSGSCSSLTSLISQTNPDTIFKFRYIFVSGTQYYLKLTRPSGLGTLSFSVLGTTYQQQPPTNCNYTPCQYIKNGGFNVDPSWNQTVFFNNQDNLSTTAFCGWKGAWGSPYIVAPSNPCAYMYSINDIWGEAIVHDMSARPLLATTYTITFDYKITGTNNGYINFVCPTTSLTYPFSSNNNTQLYPTPQFPTGQFSLGSSNLNQWSSGSVQVTIPTGSNGLALVIDPQSNIATQLNVWIDNVSITTSFTSTTTANPPVLCNGSTVLTVVSNQNPSNPPYTYSWSTSATTQSITVNTIGPFFVTVTNAIGCTSFSDDIKELNTSTLSAIFSATNTTCGECNGFINLTVTGNNPSFTYHWTDSDNNLVANTQNISGLCPDEYYVTITDAVGCIWTGSQIITENVFINSNWPQITNSSGYEEISDMTTDADGNVYAIGYFTGTLTIGTYSFTSITPKDIFVVKYDHCGTPILVQCYGGVTLDFPDLHIEYNSFSSRLIVAGEFSVINFTNDILNTLTASGTSDIFLATLDPGTLLCNASQQVRISSSSVDMVKGIAIKSTAVYIAGTFSGTNLHFSNSTTTLAYGGGGSDLFVCRFLYTLASMTWAQNYSPNNVNYEKGFTLQAVNTNYTPFFTYIQPDINGVMCSYITKLNPLTGAKVTTSQIGTGADYYEIYDMNTSSNNLYLCGYFKTNYTTTVRQAAVIYYPAPLTSIAWGNPNSKLLLSELSANPLSKCEATKLAVNANGVFVSGTYDYDNFRFWNGALYSAAISLYTPSVNNHFVYKTDATLTPASGWLSGVAATTSGNSYGNTLCYDAARNVYYMGGAFNGIVKLTGAAGQIITAYMGGYDGFLARFQDNSGANYLRLANNKPDENKVENTSFTLYPNPTNSKVFVKTNNGEAITNIVVSDVTGRIVYEKNFGSDVYEIENDFSYLQPNTYFIKLSTTNNVYNTKFVIVK